MRDDKEEIKNRYTSMTGILSRIEEQIERHPVLSKVCHGNCKDLNVLRKEYGDDVVNYAVELIDIYDKLVASEKRLKG